MLVVAWVTSTVVYTLTIAVILYGHHKDRQQHFKEKEALLTRLGVLLTPPAISVSRAAKQETEYTYDSEGFLVGEKEELEEY